MANKKQKPAVIQTAAEKAAARASMVVRELEQQKRNVSAKLEEAKQQAAEAKQADAKAKLEKKVAKLADDKKALEAAIIAGKEERTKKCRLARRGRQTTSEWMAGKEEDCMTTVMASFKKPKARKAAKQNS